MILGNGLHRKITEYIELVLQNTNNSEIIKQSLDLHHLINNDYDCKIIEFDGIQVEKQDALQCLQDYEKTQNKITIIKQFR